MWGGVVPALVLFWDEAEGEAFAVLGGAGCDEGVVVGLPVSDGEHALLRHIAPVNVHLRGDLEVEHQQFLQRFWEREGLSYQVRTAKLNEEPPGPGSAG